MLMEGNSSNNSLAALEQRQLQYPLCALVALAVLFNLVFFVWHCLYFRASHVPFSLRIFVVLFAGAMHVVYIVLDIAIVLLLLYVDVQSTGLCKTGAFFAVYAILASVWTLAPSGVLMFGLTRSVLLQQMSSSDDKRQVCHWRHLLCYTTLAAVHVIMIVVSLLPQTDLDYFTTDALSDNYYVCASLHQPTAGAWQFSTFTVVLVWIPTLAGSTAVACTIATTVKNKGGVINAKFQAFPYHIIYHLAIDCGFWLLLILLFSVNFFSAGASIHQLDAIWLFAYWCVLVTIVHPISKGVLIFIKSRYGPPQPTRSAVKVNVDLALARCPKTIQCIQQLSSSTSNPGLDAAKYLILWTENGQPKQGTLKVFPTVALSNWQREINAMTKLQRDDSKNIVKCLWASQTNIYENVLRVYSTSSVGSIICLEHDSNETLKQFLNASRPPEQQVQKIALDINAGLEYIHQHNIVHNALTTTTVYITPSAQSNSQGIDARIGDFENSYEIRCTSVASSVASDRDNEFAPDIHAFSTILLDLLLALNSRAAAHAHPDIIPVRARSEGVQSRTSDDTSLAPSVCSCPVEVQNLRVLGAGDSSPLATSPSTSAMMTNTAHSVHHNDSLERMQFNSLLSNFRELKLTSALQSKAAVADSRRQQAAAKTKKHRPGSASGNSSVEQAHGKPVQAAATGYATIFEDEILQSHLGAQPKNHKRPTSANPAATRPNVSGGSGQPITAQESAGPIHVRNRSDPVKTSSVVNTNTPGSNIQTGAAYFNDAVVIENETVRFATPPTATSEWQTKTLITDGSQGQKQQGHAMVSSHDGGTDENVILTDGALFSKREPSFVRHSEAETEDIWLNQYASKQQRRDREDDRSSTDTNSNTRFSQITRPIDNLLQSSNRPVRTRTSEV